jgi:hypothetical protein
MRNSEIIEMARTIRKKVKLKTPTLAEITKEVAIVRAKQYAKAKNYTANLYL